MNVRIVTTIRDKLTGVKKTSGRICMLLDEHWTHCGRYVPSGTELTEFRPTEPICREIWDNEHPAMPLEPIRS